MSHVDETPTASAGKLALPSALYDVAKDATTIYIPAAAVLYVSLAAIWHWAYATEVSLTSVAIVTFLGIVLKISTASYNNSEKSTDGTLHVDQSDPLTDKYVVDLSKSDLDTIAQQDKITLKVNNTTASGTSQN